MARKISRPRARANTPPLPPLPATVHTALGPVPVALVPDLKARDGEELFGMYDAVQRRIAIRAGMPPVVQWQTLWHERIHAILSDAGVQLSHEHAEATCDAIGSALVAEMVDAARGKRRG